METNNKSDKSILAIKAFLKEYLNIRQDKDDENSAVSTIRDGVDLKGATLWTLILAVFIACIGLNQNSTAVIIGAMLIAPLIGPIMGIGLAIGQGDVELMKRSFKSYIVTTLFGICTSTLFFLISPVVEGQSELLARTSPTIYDVFIALFGGMAGFIALSTTKKGSVIPGVAIATALMPPLCTAGYGIATGNLIYFLGAIYLYFINSVFIAVSTYIGTRVMHFRRKEFVDKQTERRVRKYIIWVVVLTMIPAIYLTVSILRNAFYENAINNFVNEQLTFENTQVVDKKVRKEGSKRELRVVLVGQEVPDSVIMAAQRKMVDDYKLDNTQLVVLQGVSGQDNLDVSAVRTKVLEDFYTTNGQRMEQQNGTIDSLQKRLNNYVSYESAAQSLVPEMKVLYPNVTRFSLMHTLEMRTDSAIVDTVTYAIIKSNRRMTEDQQQKMIEWMKARTGSHDLRLLFE